MRKALPPLPSRMVTLQIPVAYTADGLLPCDSTTEQELNMLLLSYTSKNQRFNSVRSMTYDFYMCTRAHRLGLYKAQSFIQSLVGRQLIDYLRKHNPIIGYGWSRDFAIPTDRLMRRKFLEALTQCKSEFTVKIPIKLLWENENEHQS